MDSMRRLWLGLALRMTPTAKARRPAKSILDPAFTLPVDSSYLAR